MTSGGILDELGKGHLCGLVYAPYIQRKNHEYADSAEDPGATTRYDLTRVVADAGSAGRRAATWSHAL